MVRTVWSLNAPRIYIPIPPDDMSYMNDLFPLRFAARLRLMRLMCAI